MSDTCGERMQICKVLMVQAGAWVIFKLKCIPEKATVVSEGAVRKDLNEEKKKTTQFYCIGLLFSFTQHFRHLDFCFKKTSAS